MKVAKEAWQARDAEIAELVEALERSIGRIEDMLKADDGQAWKETERALPVLKEVLAKHKG